jgi:hypothetical protein
MAQQAEKGTFAVKVRVIGRVCFRAERREREEREKRMGELATESESERAAVVMALVSELPARGFLLPAPRRISPTALHRRSEIALDLSETKSSAELEPAREYSAGESVSICDVRGKLRPQNAGVATARRRRVFFPPSKKKTPTPPLFFPLIFRFCSFSRPQPPSLPAQLPHPPPPKQTRIK